MNHSTYLTTSLALILLLAFSSLMAQSPQKFSSQVVVRDASGDIVSESPVQIRITILQGSASGTQVYQELHTPVTNVNGLSSFEIGGGPADIGDFAAMNWSAGPYFIRTEVDPTNSSNYSVSSTTELLSVPYALHAETSSDNHWSENANGIHTDVNRVGINSEDPEHTLDVRSMSLSEPAGLNVSNSDKSRYLRIFSGSDVFPDPSVAWAPSHSLLFATFDDNSLDFQERMRITTQGDVGIGVVDPQAKLDIAGGDWNLDAGNPGDFRIGNATNNFRIGVATGGGGAGNTRMYTNSNTLILGVNDTPSLRLETDGGITAPSLTNALIDDSGAKALVTKEYLESNIATDKAAIKMYNLSNISALSNNIEQSLIFSDLRYNFGGGTHNTATGAYTIPHTGVYDITSNLKLNFVISPSDELILIHRVYVNGVISAQYSFQTETTVNNFYGQTLSISSHLSLEANDVVSFRILPRWFAADPSPSISQFSEISITKVY